jgi:tetratricopeptide (TPR) repeat protein
MFLVKGGNVTRQIIILACAFLMLSTRGNCEPIENTPAADGAYDRDVKKQASYEKYLDTLQREHDLFPLNPSSRRNLAEAYATYCLQLLTRKQYEQADTYIVKAIELYPEEARK